MHPRDEDEESADYDLMNFYSQMRLRFDNIASIVGMCTDVEPYYIIYEYLERVSAHAVYVRTYHRVDPGGRGWGWDWGQGLRLGPGGRGRC